MLVGCRMHENSADIVALDKADGSKNYMDDAQRKVVSSLQVAGMDLEEVRYTPNSRDLFHSHDKAHFCMGLSGDCMESFSKGTHEWTRSSVGFSSPGESHSVRYGESGFHWFRVELDLADLAVCHPFMDKYLQRGALVHGQGGELGELFFRLYREYRAQDDLSPLIMHGLVFEMLADVYRQPVGTFRRFPNWLLVIRDFLESHIEKKISLSALGQLVQMHPVHVTREFQKYYHCTIGEYIRRRRIENACHLLAGSDMPIVEIALATGFCDQSHMTRVFNRVLGITPAGYRRVARNG